jgi:hypothetical protein
LKAAGIDGANNSFDMQQTSAILGRAQPKEVWLRRNPPLL